MVLVAVISRGDGSTGWGLANLAAHHWLFGMWPKQAQDEVWGESPDNLIGSALIFPRGRAHKVEGGYRLTGQKYGGLTLNARVDNIFDKRYQEVFGFATPRRTILIGGRASTPF